MEIVQKPVQHTVVDTVVVANEPYVLTMCLTDAEGTVAGKLQVSSLAEHAHPPLALGEPAAAHFRCRIRRGVVRH